MLEQTEREHRTNRTKEKAHNSAHVKLFACLVALVITLNSLTKEVHTFKSQTHTNLLTRNKKYDSFLYSMAWNNSRYYLSRLWHFLRLSHDATTINNRTHINIRQKYLEIKTKNLENTVQSTFIRR